VEHDAMLTFCPYVLQSWCTVVGEPTQKGVMPFPFSSHDGCSKGEACSVFLLVGAI